MAPLSIILHRGVIPLSSMTNCQSDRVPRLPIVINRRSEWRRPSFQLTRDPPCCFPSRDSRKIEDRPSHGNKKTMKFVRARTPTTTRYTRPVADSRYVIRGFARTHGSRSPCKGRGEFPSRIEFARSNFQFLRGRFA